MAEPREDPISGQRQDTQHQQSRGSRQMEQWRAGRVKEEEEREAISGTVRLNWQLLPPLTHCYFSTSLYQIPLSLLLLTSGPSMPKTFPTTGPSLHRSVRLVINIEHYKPFPMSCDTRAHRPTTRGTVWYIRPDGEGLQESDKINDLSWLKQK